MVTALYCSLDYVDLVLWNGPIITMDRNRRIVEAVAVKDGRITAAGYKPEVQRFIGLMTEIVDPYTALGFYTSSAAVSLLHGG